MTNRLALSLLSLAMLPAVAVQAASTGTAALTGCWELRDTEAEIARSAEDPYYAASLTYCFDEGGAGQLVSRAVELSGFQNDAGEWVDGGGDGWEELQSYHIAGDLLHIDHPAYAKVCVFSVSADVLALSECTVDGKANLPEAPDTTYDRAVTP
jgi:hypothetical protein